MLGYLFGSTEARIEKRELLLLITPRVGGTALDAARVTDRMRKVTPELEQSFKLAPTAAAADLSAASATASHSLGLAIVRLNEPEEWC